MLMMQSWELRKDCISSRVLASRILTTPLVNPTARYCAFGSKAMQCAKRFLKMLRSSTFFVLYSHRCRLPEYPAMARRGSMGCAAKHIIGWSWPCTSRRPRWYSWSEVAKDAEGTSMTIALAVLTTKSGASNSSPLKLWGSSSSSSVTALAFFWCSENRSKEMEITGPPFSSSNQATIRSWWSKKRTKPSTPPVTIYGPTVVRKLMALLCTRTTLRAVLSVAFVFFSDLTWAHMQRSPSTVAVAARSVPGM
mmetsp:Transcript_108954/g.188581  ORF Transcript_108954/g.188581 Transcript_108954/m.188581 type:complete len:251 (-) Transcript_108954:733-1485(-)